MDNNEQQPIVNHTSEKEISVEDIIPNPRNPNTHSEKQIKLLGKIIKFQGWRLPIVVSNLSGFIVRGHGRLETAKHLGLEKAPVSYQDYENEAQEWSDLIADNRIAELAEIDRGSLKDLIEELDTGELDLDLTGFDGENLEKLMSEFHQDTEIDDMSDSLGEYYALEIKCENEQKQEELYRKLTTQGHKCKILTL